MAMTTQTGVTRLTAVLPLPPGYTLGDTRFIKGNGAIGVGVRRDLRHNNHIFAEVDMQTRFDVVTVDVLLRFAVRATNYTTSKERPYYNPHPWIEYSDIETLVSAVLARHRMGAWYGH